MKKISKSLIKKSTTWKPFITSNKLINSNSWFSHLESKFLREPTTSNEVNTENIRCKKVQLNPNRVQRNILLTWFELSRITYNITLKLLNQEKLSKLKMRDKVKEHMRENVHLYGIQKNSNVYQQTIDFSVFDVFKAQKSAFANLKNKNIKFFKLRYKKQKHHLKTLVLDPTIFNVAGMGFKKKNLENLCPSELIVSNRATRMGYNTRTKKFTLYIPYDKKVNGSFVRYNVCALDPGIRTFQTLYSPSGLTCKIGDDNQIIKKNIDKIEKVKELKDKNWYKKYVSRLREKLKNRINDLHWKTASFLCKNFNTILVGNMSTKGVVSNKLNLHSSTKRMTYALSHFLFKEKLKSKALEYNCIYKEVDESYTSKTCGGCGELNENLGSSKIFNCNLCFYKMDRDIHGARNIYIKNS